MNWNERYDIDEWLFGTQPAPFIVETLPLIKPGGRVLAIGDGEGRNGVWLAEQGMQVTSVDIAENALIKAQKLAHQRNVTIDTQCLDLTNWHWPIQKFDAVVSIFVHFAPEFRDQIHRNMIAALNDKGILIIEGFHTKQLEYGNAGPKDAAMLYDEAFMQQTFEALECCHLQAGETTVFKIDEPDEIGFSVQYAGRRNLIV